MSECSRTATDLSMPPKFRELSSVDQFRVLRFLTRGEASDDPALAAITLETAEHYQTKSHILSAFYRWWPVVLALFLVVGILPDALDGQIGMVILLLLLALGLFWHVMLNPWTRPKNVARSMEASRRVRDQVASREADPDRAAQ